MLVLLLVLPPTTSPCSETWIVMDLMDRGNLAAAVRHGSMFLDGSGSIDAVRGAPETVSFARVLSTS
jgi:hypothetical protein